MCDLGWLSLAGYFVGWYPSLVEMNIEMMCQKRQTKTLQTSYVTGYSFARHRDFFSRLKAPVLSEGLAVFRVVVS